MKLKKGDTIQIMTGKDRGRSGKIEKVLVSENRVLVPGLNQYKKHRKSQGEGKPGEIVTMSRPFDISKVAMICTKCKQVTRIGYRYDGKKKVRVCRKCEADL
jgi:large subunit ribosomal protein L24